MKKRDRELEKEAERFAPAHSITCSTIINENNKVAMTHVAYVTHSDVGLL